MKQLLLVGIGGFFGSVARFGIGSWVLARFASPFPFSTLAINILGCLLIGIVAALGEKRGILTGDTRLFLITGILGGFTTFSAFGLETFTLLRGGKPVFALLYVGASVVGGLLMVALGWALVGSKNPANL